MFSKRKRIPPLRGDQTPSPPRRGAPTSRPILIKKIVETVAAAPPHSPPQEERVLVVGMTPGGSICDWDGDSKPPIINNLDRLKAMELSGEDADDLPATTPCHVQQCRMDKANLEYPVSSPDRRAMSTEAHIMNVANVPIVPNVSSVEADIRPSTSGMATTSKPVAMPVGAGSDLDSEYDDEFDVTPVQTTASYRLDRDIPENDELEEFIREEIDAVQRAMDEEIDHLLGVSTDYKWEQDFGTFRGSRESFSGPTPGPIKHYDTPYDAFTDIWSRDIIELIARETNRYAKQTIDAIKASGCLNPSSRLHQWVETDVDEIMILFAVYMYMGIDPRPLQKEFWMTNEVLEMPKFKKLMSYDRYLLLSKFLHFIDNSDASQNLPSSGGVVLSAKLASLAPVISHLNQKFTSLYNLDEKICIDESLTLLKGRWPWAQAIRSKATQFGIKSYELCESRTGYMYKFNIYCGKNSESTADVPLSADLGGKSTRIVLDLLKGLERRGHCVTMDNFYNSPALARYLKSLGFDCLGTLRTNRRNVPSDIAKIPANVATGTITARHCGDVSIIAWKDTRVVTVLSTYHDPETYVGSKAGRPLVIPLSVRNYNYTMAAIDWKDRQLSKYLLERKRGVKWYVKMFKRLLNVSIHNAFVLYLASLRRRGKPLMTHRQFRYALAEGLVQEHVSSRVDLFPEDVEEDVRLRKDVTHVPQYVPGSNKRMRCVVCLREGKRNMVHSRCVTCDEPLCFEPCWEVWHTDPRLKEKDGRGRKRQRND